MRTLLTNLRTLMFAQTIRRQLMLSFSSATILLMMGFGYGVVQQQRGVIHDQSLAHATALSKTLAVSSGSWVLANDVAGLQEVVASVGDSPHMDYVMVLSPDLRVIAATNPKSVGLYLTDPTSLLLMSAGNDTQQLLNTNRQIDVASPIILGNRMIGWARIGLSLDEEAQVLRSLYRHAILAASIGILLILAVSSTIARFLTERLAKLTEAANRIQAGERGIQVEQTAPDEIGTLYGHFNRMVESLSDSERHLERMNQVYAAWTECTDLIVSQKGERLLFEGVCNILARRVGFSLVWIGFVTEQDGEWVRPMISNENKSAYLNRIRISVAPNRPEGNGPVGKAIREGRPEICDDFLNAPETKPWHDAARLEKFQSVAAFPLRRRGKSCGVLAVYADNRNVFSPDIVTLLSGLTEDISFALDGLDVEMRRRYAENQMMLAARVYENSNEGIIITDAETRILSVNRSFSTITQFSAEEVIGKVPTVLSSSMQSEDFYQGMWKRINDTGFWQGEITNKRRDGSLYPEWLSIIAVKDDMGTVMNYIGIFSDISERKLSEERIRNLAHYDALTGLPNRILFRDRLEQALIKAQRKSEKVAILFLDLDRFKHINDTLGHGVGDGLLKEIGARLLSCVRDQDTVSRQGGDEFIIVLPETDAPGAAIVAEHILHVASRRCEIDGYDLHITPSIGISIYPDDAIERDVLIKYADVAMYQAKDGGRNTYRFYTSDMNNRVLERMSIESGLREALENDRFVLYYQPQISLDTGRIVGCEALIRWNRPVTGIVSPASFIPIAEDTGLIIPIGDWVMKQACEQAISWQKAGLPAITMAINLSAIQFSHTHMSGQITRLLQETGLPPDHLELELTESVLMHGVEKTLRTLNSLAEFGLNLSIDDFGTGYSSLAYLKQFPLNKLKIDQSFVRDITTDSNDAAIVRTIIGMAKSLNLRVIAEGVETAEQALFLRQAGCDEMQGYYFSPPVPADQFAAMLRSGKTLEI